MVRWWGCGFDGEENPSCERTRMVAMNLGSKGGEGAVRRPRGLQRRNQSSGLFECAPFFARCASSARCAAGGDVAARHLHLLPTHLPCMEISGWDTEKHELTLLMKFSKVVFNSHHSQLL